MVDPKKEKLVRLAGFPTPIEAHNLKNSLLANGINAFVANEASNLAMGGSLFGTTLATLVEVFVFESEFADAKLFLAEIPEAAKINYPAWTCRCGEEIDEGFGVCWQCGTIYESVPEENPS